jgi:hypothetical protein
MTPRSGRTAPSPGALRMRRARERRRQGDVMVSLKVGPNMTADLAELGWLPAPDRVDKDTIAHALDGLIDHAITMRVTPSTGIEAGHVAPSRVNPGPFAIGLDESDGLSAKSRTPFEWGSPHDLELGRVRPGDVLGEADIVADIVEDKPPEAQPRDLVDTPDIAVEHAELSRLELSEAQPWAEPPQPFEVDLVRLWVRRLTLWQRWKMWVPQWGPRPDQDGCLAPDYLL